MGVGSWGAGGWWWMWHRGADVALMWTQDAEVPGVCCAVETSH